MRTGFIFVCVPPRVWCHGMRSRRTKNKAQGLCCRPSKTSDIGRGSATKNNRIATANSKSVTVNSKIVTVHTGLQQ